MPIIPAAEVIQTILAPAIMISSCGLIMLGLQNRYSNIVNRIRALNDERRRLQKLIANGKELEYSENVRYYSVREQINDLSARALLIRNAIFLEIVAVLFFVLSSILIGVYLLYQIIVIQLFPLFSFLLGMISVFIGLIFFGIEILRAYRVVQLEIAAEE